VAPIRPQAQRVQGPLQSFFRWQQQPGFIVGASSLPPRRDPIGAPPRFPVPGGVQLGVVKPCQVASCTLGVFGDSQLCFMHEDLDLGPKLAASKASNEAADKTGPSAVKNAAHGAGQVAHGWPEPCTECIHAGVSCESHHEAGNFVGLHGPSNAYSPSGSFVVGAQKRCVFPTCASDAQSAGTLCVVHAGENLCLSARCSQPRVEGTSFCQEHSQRARCKESGCVQAPLGTRGFCKLHRSGKSCTLPGCTKSSRGSTGLCKAHGGGKRCMHENCGKSAQGSTWFCKAHGGGKRCIHESCNKSAQGSTWYCKAHGGGKRCTREKCTKSALGGSGLCSAHGGGRRCQQEGCTKSARGSTSFCSAHGGGRRCDYQGCTKSARGSAGFCAGHGGKRATTAVQQSEAQNSDSKAMDT